MIFQPCGPVLPTARNPGLRSRQQAFALGALAGQLAGAADGFSLLARTLFRRLFVVHVTLHLAEAAFALHLLLQRLQGLVDVVVADENLNQVKLSFGCPPRPVRETGRQMKSGVREAEPSDEGGLIHERPPAVQIVTDRCEGSKRPPDRRILAV